MPDNINVKLSLQLDPASLNAVRSQIQTQLSNAKINLGGTSSSVGGNSNAGNFFKNIGKEADDATGKVKTFGNQLEFTAKRLGAYYILAGSFFKLTAGIGQAADAVVDLDKQMNRLTQIFNGNRQAAKALTDDIIDFGKAYGQSAREVLQIADTLAQAGDKFGGSVKNIARAAELIAKTKLAATFGEIGETTEGVIAILNQFNLTADDTAKVLDITNGLAKSFAAEAGDLFKAVKAGGGAFALADNDLNNFAATVVALRSITRLTASQVGTALNTISVRNLREDVVQFTEELTGGKIRNVDGSLKNLTQRFIEVAKATKGLSDEQLAPVLEKLSDTRQAKFFIPLIRDIQKGSGVSVFLKALEESKKQAGSFSRDVALGLDRIEVTIGKIGAEFEDLFKNIAENQGIKELVKDFANLAKFSADALKFILPIVPAIAKIGLSSLLFKGIQTAFKKTNGFGGLLNTGYKYNPINIPKRSEPIANIVPNEYIEKNTFIPTDYSRLEKSGAIFGLASGQSAIKKQEKIKTIKKIQQVAQEENLKNTYGIAETTKNPFAKKPTSIKDAIDLRDATRFASAITKPDAPDIKNIIGSTTRSSIIGLRSGAKDIVGLRTADKLKQKYLGASLLNDQQIATLASNQGLILGLNDKNTNGPVSLGPGINSRSQNTEAFKAAAKQVTFDGALKMSDRQIIRIAKQRKLLPQDFNTGGIYKLSSGNTSSKNFDEPTIARTNSQYGVVTNRNPFNIDINAIRANRIQNAQREAFGPQSFIYSKRQLDLSNRISNNQVNLKDLAYEKDALKLTFKSLKVSGIALNKAFLTGKISEEEYNSQKKAIVAELKLLKSQYAQTSQKEKALQEATQEMINARTRNAAEANSGGINSGFGNSLRNGIVNTGGALLNFANNPLAGIKSGAGFIGNSFKSVGKSAGSFLKNNPQLLTLGLSLGGSYGLDQAATNAQGDIQSDLFGRLNNKNGIDYQKQIQTFNRNNTSAQTRSGAFSGASTGLSLAAGAALIPGIGIPAALGILAGGAIIGGIGGAISGKSKAREQQRKELLGSLAQEQDPVKRAVLEKSFLKNIRREGKFDQVSKTRTGNKINKGDFAIDPNSFAGGDTGFFNPRNSLFGRVTGLQRKAVLFQDEYANQLNNSEEGKASVQAFKERALDTASKFTSGGPNFAGRVREALVKEEAENLKKAAAATGKSITDQQALGQAAFTVSEKLRAAGLTTDEAGSALGKVKDNIDGFNKTVDEVRKKLASSGPSIVNFGSNFTRGTEAFAARNQTNQIKTNLSEATLSGIFGGTTNVSTNGIAKAFTDQLKSDVNNLNPEAAGILTSSRLGNVLGSKNANVFGDIARIQSGLGNINQDVVGRLAGKTFSSSDTLESGIQALLPQLFKQQGINVQTGEGKDLLGKVQDELQKTLESPEGRKAFEQDRAGFVTGFLKKFSVSLDDAGARVEQAFIALQQQIDKANSDFEKFRTIQTKFNENRQQQFNLNVSKIQDSAALGASSRQLSGAFTGLITSGSAGIYNGSTLRNAGQNVIDKQNQLVGLQAQLQQNPGDANLLQAAAAAQRDLVSAQDDYNKVINDTNNAMTLLKGRIEETSKQFALLTQTTTTAGSKSFGDFNSDSFKLEQFSSQFGDVGRKLSAAGISTYDQFAALSQGDKDKLLGGVAGAASSQSGLSAIEAAKQYGGLRVKGSNINNNDLAAILQGYTGEKRLGDVSGFENAGSDLSKLGKDRQIDFQALADLQQNQIDVQSGINDNVLNIYKFLTSQSGNNGNTPQANANNGNTQTVNLPGVSELTQALTGVTQAIANASGKSQKVDFNANVKLDGVPPAPNVDVVKNAVASLMGAFLNNLDRSDPTQAAFAQKLQDTMKTFQGGK